MIGMLQDTAACLRASEACLTSTYLWAETFDIGSHLDFLLVSPFWDKKRDGFPSLCFFVRVKIYRPNHHNQKNPSRRTFEDRGRTTQRQAHHRNRDRTRRSIGTPARSGLLTIEGTLMARLKPIDNSDLTRRWSFLIDVGVDMLV